KVTHVVNDCLFLQYIDATRSVPRDQLNALKDRRIADLEEKGTKITNQLRDDVETTAHAELLRLQPVKHHRSNFYIDIKRQLLVIDEKADGKCEDVIGGIRKALGSFSCLPIRLGAKPCDYANDWVS
ncbi:recombination-associated protein RdgC, partial [Vibrio anguillarum]